jgi:hypothetical protein
MMQGSRRQGGRCNTRSTFETSRYNTCNIRLKTDETVNTCVWNSWETPKKHLKTTATHTQHPDKHNCNIRLKKQKHWEQTFATYVYNHCNYAISQSTFTTLIRNICNKPLRHMKHTLTTYAFSTSAMLPCCLDEWSSSLLSSTPTGARCHGVRGGHGCGARHWPQQVEGAAQTSSAGKIHPVTASGSAQHRASQATRVSGWATFGWEVTWRTLEPYHYRSQKEIRFWVWIDQPNFLEFDKLYRKYY